MNKNIFLAELRKRMPGLQQSDIEEQLNFYSEMIDDQMEEGFSEEEAVSAVGTIDEIVPHIIADIPLSKILNEKIIRNKKIRIWEIVLLILGSPIWLSLIIAAFTVIVSLYVVLWSVIISLWAIFASAVGCVFGGIIAGVIFVCAHNTLAGIAMIGIGIMCLGLSIFLFYGCKASTKGTILLTKKITTIIKICFIKKEEAK